MPSLTPLSRSDEVNDLAMKEGLFNGLLTLMVTSGAVYAASKQSAKFRQVTNMQARTAIAIMPALLIFTFTAEEKVMHRMKEMAQESQHSSQSVRWAERQLTKRSQVLQVDAAKRRAQEHEELTDLYRQSVYESGVRVIPGNVLSVHHIAANYVAENPFKVLASLAVPSVAWIFYGRQDKRHLDFQMKLMHTRVFGQFATLGLLMGVMGFKELMDRHGKFITEGQADARVAEMHEVRDIMLDRLAEENAAKAAYEREILKAHNEDVKNHTVSSIKKNKKKKKKQRKQQHEQEEEASHGEAAAAAVSPMAVSPQM